MALRAAAFWGAVALLGSSALGSGVGCGRSAAPLPLVAVAGEVGACDDCAGQSGAPAGLGGAGGKLGEAGMASSAGAATGLAGAGLGGTPETSQAGAGGEPSLVMPELSLSAITIAQTLELPLMQQGSSLGAEQRPVPLVAGKRALVRAFVELGPGFSGRALLGVLDVKSSHGTRSLVTPLNVTQSSQPDDLATTFVFDVAAADLTTDSSYRVRVLEPDASPLTRYPDIGYAPLGARAVEPFRLVLVPFVSNGFAPKTGSAEIAALQRRLQALYPVTDVEVDLAAPVTLGYVVNGDGDGWDSALDQIYQTRSDAAPPANAYYFGMLAPAASYSSYCQNGCILGYSNVADPADVDSRGAIGVTVFPDGSGEGDAWDTVAHELGHALGREHSPCGITDPASIDSAWPADPTHRNAAIGSYGFDFERMKLLRPRSYRDVMSYCSPIWISDYTYQGLFERLQYVNGSAFRFAPGFSTPAPEAPTPASSELFRIARIRRSGESVWLAERRRHGSSRERPLDLVDAAGQRVGSVQAQIARVDHAPGAYVWLRASELALSGAVGVDLRPLGGSVLAF